MWWGYLVQPVTQDGLALGTTRFFYFRELRKMLLTNSQRSMLARFAPMIHFGHPLNNLKVWKDYASNQKNVDKRSTKLVACINAALASLTGPEQSNIPAHQFYQQFTAELAPCCESEPFPERSPSPFHGPCCQEAATTVQACGSNTSTDEDTTSDEDDEVDVAGDESDSPHDYNPIMFFGEEGDRSDTTRACMVDYWDAVIFPNNAKIHGKPVDKVERAAEAKVVGELRRLQ